MKIHWDRKTVENITGHKLIERIVVKALVDDKEQILGCPPSGKKGIDVAETVLKLIEDWELQEYVVSLCFDTTYVNSGRSKGAAIRLETHLDKRIQFFPCRHHIYELVLRVVYEHFMGATKSDTVKRFGDFKKTWENIDKKEYAPGTADIDINAVLIIKARG